MNNDYTKFKEVDWSEFYPNAEEVITLNTPTPMGSPVTVAGWVDANHAGNLANRRYTGFIMCQPSTYSMVLEEANHGRS